MSHSPEKDLFFSTSGGTTQTLGTAPSRGKPEDLLGKSTMPQSSGKTQQKPVHQFPSHEACNNALLLSGRRASIFPGFNAESSSRVSASCSKIQVFTCQNVRICDFYGNAATCVGRRAEIEKCRLIQSTTQVHSSVWVNNCAAARSAARAEISQSIFHVLVVFPDVFGFFRGFLISPFFTCISYVSCFSKFSFASLAFLISLGFP